MLWMSVMFDDLCDGCGYCVVDVYICVFVELLSDVIVVSMSDLKEDLWFECVWVLFNLCEFEVLFVGGKDNYKLC